MSPQHIVERANEDICCGQIENYMNYMNQIENCLLYFFLSKSKQVVQLVIIFRENENQMHHFPYAVGY